MSTNSAMSSPSFNNSSSVGAAEAAPVERRCENANCNATKLLSIVPKRKVQQFVTDPIVMEKPTLINGFTTIFQVDGVSAKLSDLKSVSSTNQTNPKMIYRVVPNTHAHIVNYVVVDADGISLRKISENEPATMRKLLESQKVSADQMLKKLTGGSQTGGVLHNLSSVDGVNTVTSPLVGGVGGVVGVSNLATAGAGVAGRADGVVEVDNAGTSLQMSAPGANGALNMPATNSVLPTVNISTKLPTKPTNKSNLNKSNRAAIKSTIRSTIKATFKSTNSAVAPKLPTIPKPQSSLSLSSSSSSPQSAPVSSSTSVPLVQTISSPILSTSLPLSSPSTSLSVQLPNMSNPQIQLPLRMHPNLKITAVASANTVPGFKPLPTKPNATVTAGTSSPLSASLKTTTTTTPSSSSSSTNVVPGPSVPLITPVPLSALKCPSPSPTPTAASASTSSTSSSLPVVVPQHSNVATVTLPLLQQPQQQSQQPPQQTPPTATMVDKPVFDKMQAELQELRRTVALLAEAHAKTNLSQQQQEQIQKMQQQLPQQHQLQQQHQQQQQQQQPPPAQVVPVQLKSAVPLKPQQGTPKTSITSPIVAKSVTGDSSIWGGKRLRQS